MKYKYKAYDKNGNKITGKIEAVSIEEAKSKLKNVILIDIKEIKEIRDVNLPFIKNRKVSKKKLSSLFHSLGLYLKSSIPLTKALLLLKNQVDDVLLKNFIEEIYNYINEGKSFYNALEIQKVIFIPEYVKNIIKVGEESGKLEIVLLEIASFLKEEDKIFSKISQALIYPFFIIAVAIFLVGFMLTVIVPKIVNVFSNMHQQLPSITLFVIDMGNFLKENYLILIFSVSLSIWGFVFLYNKNKKFKFFIDTILLKIPLVNKIILAKELGRFSYLTFVLTKSGVNYIKAIKLAVNTLTNEKIKQIFNSAINETVKGNKFSISLLNSGFNFDKSFLQAISLGEETSQIKEIMENLALIYAEENQSRISVLLSLIEPLLILIVGAAIGFIVTALLLPMLNMNILH